MWEPGQIGWESLNQMILDASSSWPSDPQVGWSVMARQSCKTSPHGWRIYLLHLKTYLEISMEWSHAQQPAAHRELSLFFELINGAQITATPWKNGSITCSLHPLVNNTSKQMEPGPNCWGLGLKFIRQRSKEGMKEQIYFEMDGSMAIMNNEEHSGPN
jgi:hypothetical protein